jgi:hypothetical protein
VAEDHGAEHHFFGQFLGFRFDHQHGDAVPATTRFELASLSCDSVGLSTYWPLM